MKAPIGTGPYKLVDYELNSSIVLERNEAYWGPKPKMKNVQLAPCHKPISSMTIMTLRAARA